MSLRRFATRTELQEQLGPDLADHIWTAASPSTDEFGNETASADPIFGGVYVDPDGDLPAEINVTRLIGKIDSLSRQIKKVR
ncbi:hypothetical protein ACXYTP_21615 [Tsukamurella ocularis]